MASQSITWRGSRIRALSELDGIPMSSIAVRIGISQSKLSKIATGVAPLETSLVDSMSLAFSVPRSFFSVMDSPGDSAAVTFRKRANTGSLAGKQVIRLFSEASRFWRFISEASGYRTADLSACTRDANSPFDAAVAFREFHGLSEEEPVRNVTRLLERSGVAVIHGLQSVSVVESGHAGICRPSRFNDRPLVACVHHLPGAVQRLTLAHELGHLIYDLDLDRQPRSRAPEEVRAFNFAAALLMPESMMRDRVNEATTLNDLLKIKSQYGVSVRALIKHAQRLGLISKQRERSLYIQANSRGWSKSEPVRIGNEVPSLLSQAFARACSSSIEAAARETGVREPLICRWLGLPEQKNKGEARIIAFPRSSG